MLNLLGLDQSPHAAHQLNILNTLGNRLRQLRGQQTIKDWAKQMRVHWNTVRNYESGRDPPTSFIARIVEVTGCSSDWLIFGRDLPLARSQLSTPMVAETSAGLSNLVINQLHNEVFTMLTVFQNVKCFFADHGLDKTEQDITELTSSVLNSLQISGVSTESPPSSASLQALIAAIYELRADHIGSKQVAERIAATSDEKRTALK